MPNVSIIIPIYKTSITYYEKKSLSQSLRLLLNYDIYLIHPRNIDLSFYKTYFKENNCKFITKEFDSTYFSNIKGYNNLLTSSCFYDSFSNIDYLLIYQLDAFIFKNNLDHWCKHNYAYIGASIPDHILEYLNNKHIEDFNTLLDKKGHYMNGGFSLRHVQSFRNLLNSNQEQINLYINKGWSEDVVLSIFFNKGLYKLPSKEEATKFSFESFPALSYKENNNQLPTGCHAWYRNEFTIYDNMFWFKHILPFLYYKLMIQEWVVAIIEKNIRRFKYYINLF